jgi:ribosome-associated protein
MTVRTVPIRERTIRLGQLLKLADLVDTGADAKPLLESGQVYVNGELETRRGRQLVRGDVVSVGEESVRLA